MNVTEKRLQSNNKYADSVCTCFIIWLQKLRQRKGTRQMTKGTFVAAEAQEPKSPDVWRRSELSSFFFAFCVFVQCVLIRLSNSKRVWRSSLSLPWWWRLGHVLSVLWPVLPQNHPQWHLKLRWKVNAMHECACLAPSTITQLVFSTQLNISTFKASSE